MLLTDDGTRLSQSSAFEPEKDYFTCYDRIPTQDDNRRLQMAFDGMPAGTKSLTLRWLQPDGPKPGVREVIAAFTFDLLSRTASETEYYLQEESPLYLYHPDAFHTGIWDSAAAQASADQNGFLLGDFYIASWDTEQRLDLQIYKRDGYQQVQFQVYANGQLLGTTESIHGNSLTGSSMDGYYDETSELFTEEDAAGMPFYLTSFSLEGGTISAGDNLFEIKVIDAQSGQVLMETTVKDLTYFW